MKTLAAALGAAALATAGSAAASEILIFSTDGTSDYFEVFQALPGAGDYRFEVTASRAINIDFMGHYTYHWDVFIAPPPRPHSEFIEGNSYDIMPIENAFGTFAVFSFDVPETEYEFFDSDIYHEAYGIPVGTPLYRETKHEDPSFIISGYGDTVEPFDYSVRVFQSVVPEPAAWALMILGFGAVGAALRRRSAARPAPAAL